MSPAAACPDSLHGEPAATTQARRIDTPERRHADVILVLLQLVARPISRWVTADAAGAHLLTQREKKVQEQSSEPEAAAAAVAAPPPGTAGGATAEGSSGLLRTARRRIDRCAARDRRLAIVLPAQHGNVERPRHRITFLRRVEVAVTIGELTRRLGNDLQGPVAVGGERPQAFDGTKGFGISTEDPNRFGWIAGNLDVHTGDTLVEVKLVNVNQAATVNASAKPMAMAVQTATASATARPMSRRRAVLASRRCSSVRAVSASVA